MSSRAGCSESADGGCRGDPWVARRGATAFRSYQTPQFEPSPATPRHLLAYHYGGIMTHIVRIRKHITRAAFAALRTAKHRGPVVTMHRLPVVVERAGRGCSAYCPDLPGCMATAKSCHEVTVHMSEAIQMHLEGMREDGLPVSEGRSSAECDAILSAIHNAGTPRAGDV